MREKKLWRVLRNYFNSLVVLVFIFLLPFLVFFSSVHADELDEIAEKIAKLEKAREQSIAATVPLEEELIGLKAKLEEIKTLIAVAEANIVKLEESIKEREKDFARQYVILSNKVESYYKSLRKPSMFLTLLSSKTASSLIKDLSYRESVADEDKEIIVEISAELIQLEKDKEKVEKDKIVLAKLKEKTDKQTAFFSKEIKGAKEYQEKLSGEIEGLIARQNELLAEKTGTFRTSVGDVPLSDDPARRPGYDPGFRPAFAAFSFGAPHFKGMSQYGAFGRAKNGQDYEQILKAYYGNVRIESVDTNFNINTDQGAKHMENDYLRGIAEMPASWADGGGMEALKAQAVAARSYALSYVGWRMGNRNASGSICTSEHCQVYNAGKAANPGRWGEAVEQTRGMILVSDNSGEVVNAQYSSTSGGYQESYSSLGHSTPAMWDTKCGNQGCWTGEAWEKIAGSPWFYKGWYKSRSGVTCGRGHPWLTSDEMADLVNSAVVYQHNKGNDEAISHIWQLDDCYQSGAEVWSKDKMRQEAEKHGGGAGSVSGVSVDYSNSGVTAKVIFETNKGKIEVEGMSFYKAFNRRAPGAIHLKAGLFNIEKK